LLFRGDKFPGGINFDSFLQKKIKKYKKIKRSATDGFDPKTVENSG
jgi:hypothetical protein